MSLPIYPKYTQSNIDWLGAVPDHWKILKIKRLSIVKRGASPRPIDEPKYFDDEGEYAWVRIADVTASDRFLEFTTQRMSEVGKVLSVPLKPGELFISICATVGKPIITKIKCCIHDGFVYFPLLGENRTFFYYIFMSGQPYLGLGKMGTQLNLNTETVGDISIALPTKQEQKSIASFLDHKTAQIDKLIAEKERLLKLLEEKRIALITQAVTKGLDPNVKMKPSGIDWLGDIPEHWEVKRLKFVATLKYGESLMNENRVNGNYYVYGSNGIVGTHSVAITLAPCIVIGRKGSYGRINLSLERCFPIDTTFFVDSTCTSYNIIWLYYLLPLLGLDKNSKDSAVPGLAREDAYCMYVPVPNDEEQNQIVNQLDFKMQQLKILSTEIESAIEKLKEYRISLITAAVTGKIDVRDFTPEEEHEKVH